MKLLRQSSEFNAFAWLVGVLLLMLSVELCTSSGAVMLKDPAHVLYAMDDDDAGLKEDLEREHSLTEYTLFEPTWMSELVRSVKTDLILAFEETEILVAGSGVRRHRWLCRESC